VRSRLPHRVEEGKGGDGPANSAPNRAEGGGGPRGWLGVRKKIEAWISREKRKGNGRCAEEGKKKRRKECGVACWERGVVVPGACGDEGKKGGKEGERGFLAFGEGRRNDRRREKKVDQPRWGRKEKGDHLSRLQGSSEGRNAAYLPVSVFA